MPSFGPAFAPRSLPQGNAGDARSANSEGGLPATGKVLLVPQDAEIYGEGDAAVLFYKLVRGVVRTCKFLNNGRRHIEAFQREGDVFGFEVGASYRLTAEAVSDCSLIAYRRKGVEQLAAASEVLSQQLYGYFVQGMTRAQEHALILGRRSAIGRVGAFLQGAAQQSQDGRTISLAMDRRDIADYLGLTIETVSRTLSQLERDGVIAIPVSRQIRVQKATRLSDLAA
jgi:CRP/FNR family nitrogen fixation transcriptional regulator